MARGEFTQRQRALCWERSGGYCEVCGCRLREKGWNLHHRQGRGMGGTRREVTCADGLVVCGYGNTSGCHKQMDDQRAWAVARGFVVSRHATKPMRDMPVLLRGQWVYLTDDGAFVGVDEISARVLDRGLVA